MYILRATSIGLNKLSPGEFAVSKIIFVTEA